MREFFKIRGIFTTRHLAFMGLMVALRVVLEQFTIPITPHFKAFTLAYLPGAMVAALYGPWAAMLYGLVADTAGYFARPMGAYFPLYALSEMLAGFWYACFAYRQTVSYAKIAIARLFILVTVIFGLNFVWGSMLWGSTASGFYSTARLINNLIQFPVYVFTSTWCIRFAKRLESGDYTRRAS